MALSAKLEGHVKFTFRFTIVSFGEATRTVTLTCTRKAARKIVAAHEAQERSVTVDVARWLELDSRLRPLTRV